MEVICIQETKSKEISVSKVRALWGFDEVEFVWCPAASLSGGILTSWDKNKFYLDTFEVNKHWVSICGNVLRNNIYVVIVNVYAPSDSLERRQIWNQLYRLVQACSIPCCFVGDWNSVRTKSERKGYIFDGWDAKYFNSFIVKANLVEVALLRRKFTWHGPMGKRSKLDRMLISKDWCMIFDSVKIKAFLKFLSDHCPLISSSDNRDWGPKPFRFINLWLLHPGF